ncbi:hypothetical protein F3Y22_tig00112501pilonHSYRG00097 [Hibiscus syriacus]|uniref:C2H2-type domain-containing protein n=1 Tax=Hibiscus syriacus TaxID=106335 RepID=A0A6A2Y8U8_HIBSY|nr:hypothetical protein F3Y22_tig00112501pilonHSYRG00097 [Hibiscus syriacus]
MSFETKDELRLHKRNRCPYDGCGKKFRSHKYAILHLRVHDDDRPLECPWKGCSMSFKWAWARTEHIREHRRTPIQVQGFICNAPGHEFWGRNRSTKLEDSD